MKDLLPAIKTTLHALTQLVSDADAYITPDVRWRPEGTANTCIGITDAGLHREELAGEVWEITATVELAGFVPLAANGSDALCASTGLYKLLDDASNLLKGNLLSVAGAQGCSIGDDTPSAIYQAKEDVWLVTMTRKLIYTLERSSV